MFERFAKDAREAVVHAQDEARTLGADRIGPEHVLLGAVRTARHGRRPGAGHGSASTTPRCSPRSARCPRTRSTPTRWPGSASTSSRSGRRSRRRSAPARSTRRPGRHAARRAPAVRRRRQEAARGRAARGDPLQAPPDRQRSPAARGRPPGRHRRLPGARRGRRRRPAAGARGRHRRRGPTCRSADDDRLDAVRAGPADPRVAVPARQSLVTGENRSSSRLMPSVPKSTLATAFGPAPSSAIDGAQAVRVVRDAVADRQLRDRGVGPRLRGPEGRTGRRQRRTRLARRRRGSRRPTPGSRAAARAVARAPAAAQLRGGGLAAAPVDELVGQVVEEPAGRELVGHAPRRTDRRARDVQPLARPGQPDVGEPPLLLQLVRVRQRPHGAGTCRPPCP